MNSPLFDLLMQRQMPNQGQNPMTQGGMPGMPPNPMAMPPQLANGMWSGAQQNTSGQQPMGQPPPPSPGMTNKSAPPPIPNLPKV